MKFIKNEYCELKSILTEDIIKEIITFANAKGGKIYIGVDDDGNIIGIQNVDNVLQDLTGMIVFILYRTNNVLLLQKGGHFLMIDFNIT